MFSFSFQFSPENLGLEGAELAIWLDTHGPIKASEIKVEATASQFSAAGFLVDSGGKISDRYPPVQPFLTLAIAEAVRAEGKIRETPYGSEFLARATELKIEKESREAAAEAEKATAWVTQVLSRPATECVQGTARVAPGSASNYHSYWDDPRMAERNAEIEKLIAAAKAAEEATEAEKAAAAGRAKAERDAWIGKHGSSRLKRLLAESIPCQGAYFSERLAADRPGWVKIDSRAHADPINAPQDALDLLDEARKTAPDAKLMYQPATEEDVDEDGETIPGEPSRYVCEAEFLGNEIQMPA